MQYPKGQFPSDRMQLNIVAVDNSSFENSFIAKWVKHSGMSSLLAYDGSAASHEYFLLYKLYNNKIWQVQIAEFQYTTQRKKNNVYIQMRMDTINTESSWFLIKRPEQRSYWDLHKVKQKIHD